MTNNYTPAAGRWMLWSSKTIQKIPLNNGFRHSVAFTAKRADKREDNESVWFTIRSGGAQLFKKHFVLRQENTLDPG